MKSYTTCPVDGCQRKRGVDKLMCFPHWARVPRVLQRKIWAAWQNGHPNTAHEALCDEAIALVNQSRRADVLGDHHVREASRER